MDRRSSWLAFVVLACTAATSFALATHGAARDAWLSVLGVAFAVGVLGTVWSLAGYRRPQTASKSPLIPAFPPLAAEKPPTVEPLPSGRIQLAWSTTGEVRDNEELACEARLGAHGQDMLAPRWEHTWPGPISKGTIVAASWPDDFRPSPHEGRPSPGRYDVWWRVRSGEWDAYPDSGKGTVFSFSSLNATTEMVYDPPSP